MRRTARVLYATALAGAALGAAASGAAADPDAQVSPGSVEPGGTVTVTVSCEAVGGTLPDSIDAQSQGFQEGKVQLHRVDGADPGAAGPASYSGTAHIASGEPGQGADTRAGGSGAGGDSDAAGPGAPGTGSDISVTSDAKNPGGARAGEGTADAVSPAAGAPNAPVPDAQAAAPGAGDPLVTDPAASGAVGPDSAGQDTTGPYDLGPDSLGPDTVPDPGVPDTVGPDALIPDSDSDSPGTADPDRSDPGTGVPETGGADGRWNVGGVCPAPPGGHGKQWSASYAVDRGVTSTHGPDTGTGSDTGAAERPPTVQRGVHAGEGGVFTDSVPALVTGGVLIAGAVGAAAHRLHRMRRRRF
ncbi:hypothetical protein [Streptomyces aureus]|uniref:hypothetical protein n=1 Tax=Streptomyces aureus TaxID=193461 RepID=UPI0033FFFE8E